MSRIVITSGRKYIDIDAYGAMFAYKVLLNSLGYDAYVVTSVKVNESVPKLILDLGFSFDDIKINEDDSFVVIDVSNPDFIEEFVVKDKIKEIIDHHIGYQEYWDNLNINNNIEFIGSVCTLIYERFLENKKENLINTSLAKILVAGILDNTLNFNSENTNERDRKAYNELLKLGNIDDSFRNDYFISCYNNIEFSLEENIRLGIKIEYVSDIIPEVFGQLIVVDKSIVFNNRNLIDTIFKDYDDWICNIICLNEGISYILYSSERVKNNLLKMYRGKEYHKSVKLNKCVLRKEVMKKAKDFN